MKVLIADPDWRFAEKACLFLESRAHLVVCENRPSVVLEHAQSWQPDLVILAGELAQRGLIEPLTAANPRPAILLTEHMARFDRAWQVWQKGGDELLLKPVFKIDELHDAIVVARENAAAGLRRRPVSAAVSA
jgi:DNA-binding response OmpR family regulator